MLGEGVQRVVVGQRPEAAESLRSHGAEVAASVADAIGDAEVAITMLPDTPQVEAVVESRPFRYLFSMLRRKQQGL